MKFFRSKFFGAWSFSGEFWGGAGEPSPGPYIMQKTAVFSPGGIRVGVYKR